LSSKEGALRRLFLFALGCLPLVVSAATCPSIEPDEQVIIRYVHDGDTVHLKDGRKVRLIGINAPERARDDLPAEPYAEAARQALSAAIKNSDNRVGLIYGKQRLDRYQRTLAHLVTPEDENLQQALLFRGMAYAVTFPPNETFADCYLATEQQARCNAKGIWSNPEVIVSSDDIDSAQGFQIISGVIEHVSQTRKGVWLFSEDLMIGVRSTNLNSFDTQSLYALKGKQVIVRGWINSIKQSSKENGQDQHAAKYYMRIRHPSSITTKVTDCRSLAVH
jgi:endonuclease YncB( thermonuclease family)